MVEDTFAPHWQTMNDLESMWIPNKLERDLWHIDNFPHLFWAPARDEFTFVRRRSQDKTRIRQIPV
jgi:hypothetical protein